MADRIDSDLILLALSSKIISDWFNQITRLKYPKVLFKTVVPKLAQPKFHGLGTCQPHDQDHVLYRKNKTLVGAELLDDSLQYGHL